MSELDFQNHLQCVTNNIRIDCCERQRRSILKDMDDHKITSQEALQLLNTMIVANLLDQSKHVEGHTRRLAKEVDSTIP